MGVLYIHCCWSFVILPWPACLPKISQLFVHNTPTYVPSAPAGSKRSFHGSSLEKKSLSVVQTEIRNLLPVSFCAIGFGVFVECVQRQTATRH